MVDIIYTYCTWRTVVITATGVNLSLYAERIGLLFGYSFITDQRGSDIFSIGDPRTRGSPTEKKKDIAVPVVFYGGKGKTI